MSNDRTMVFIDGANFYNSAKFFKIKINYERLLDFIDENVGDIVRSYYFTPINYGEDGEIVSPRKSIMDYLSYNGFYLVNTVGKNLNEESNMPTSSDINIELVVNMMKMAYTGRVDNIVLLSGNGDFVPAINAIQDLGINVVVMSASGENRLVSDKLRRQADEFINILDEDVRPHINQVEDNSNED
jgi:uncharacterized LabA/DUF88 family protein